MATTINKYVCAFSVSDRCALRSYLKPFVETLNWNNVEWNEFYL